MNSTKIIKDKVEECLKGSPRIKANVHTISKEIEGYDGTEVTLWYPHRNGRDDHREASNDESLVVRIERLKIKEVNALGSLVAEVASDFPDLDVVLHEARRGQFTYYFLPK